MAPRKTAPLPCDLLLSKRGIVFSLNLFQEEEDFQEDDDSFQLQVAIHKVTSSTLLSRMDKTRQDLGIAPLQPTPKDIQRKRKINATTSTLGECTWCGVKKTAQWRKGPTGARGLCNRCGIEWAKQIRYEAKMNGVSNAEAEQRLIFTYKDTDRFKRFAREHLAPELMDFQR